jgi:hypothetical protein
MASCGAQAFRPIGVNSMSGQAPLSQSDSRAAIPGPGLFRSGKRGDERPPGGRSTVLVRDQVKFRVGRIVDVALSGMSGPAPGIFFRPVTKCYCALSWAKWARRTGGCCRGQPAPRCHHTVLAQLAGTRANA